MELELILTDLQPINLAIFGNFLHSRVWSLRNQHPLQFSMEHCKTLHTCCEHIENVHLAF